MIEGIILEYRDWVAVLALTERQEVILVRQYRHGAQKVIEELPGGSMDAPDASPLEAARRELLEETGYSSERFIEVGKVSPNPASQTNLIHSFLALDAEKVGAQHLDVTEEIEVLLKPLEEVIHMAKSGELLELDAGEYSLLHPGLLEPDCLTCPSPLLRLSRPSSSSVSSR